MRIIDHSLDWPLTKVVNYNFNFRSVPHTPKHTHVNALCDIIFNKQMLNKQNTKLTARATLTMLMGHANASEQMNKWANKYNGAHIDIYIYNIYIMYVSYICTLQTNCVTRHQNMLWGSNCFRLIVDCKWNSTVVSLVAHKFAELIWVFDSPPRRSLCSPNSS